MAMASLAGYAAEHVPCLNLRCGRGMTMKIAHQQAKTDGQAI